MSDPVDRRSGSSYEWGEDDLGHHGDPTEASAEIGEILYDTTVDTAVEFLKDLYAYREGRMTSD